ncbi:MAG: carbohydrate binding domain-containing protein, partial [Paludibacteraceae bacterium]|nr:carbohydrate binding domain-containing protein [Paludibacteraceae bacterium]
MKKNYAYTMMLMGFCCLPANAQSLIDEDFESGKGDWASRGGESVAVSKDAAHSGNQSLKVSSRSSYWNGASIGSKEFEAGKSYNVEAYVYFDGSTYKPASAITGDMVPLKDAYVKDKYFRFGTCVSGYGVTNAATQ